MTDRVEKSANYETEEKSNQTNKQEETMAPLVAGRALSLSRACRGGLHGVQLHCAEQHHADEQVFSCSLLGGQPGDKTGEGKGSYRGGVDWVGRGGDTVRGGE